MAFSLSTALGLSSIVSTATSIAGGILGVVGAVQEHNQAQANSEMQAQQMEYNQRLEEREASRIEQETAENARRQREASEQLKAQQRALLGKSGAAMTSGSPLAILGQTAEDEEQKIQDVHYSGYQAAQQHRNQASMFKYQAGVARAQAPSSSSLGLSIAGNAVNTVGNLAQIGGNYVTGKVALKKSGMAGESLF